ncbi:MAG: class I SAM-dependent methyltransferase [Dehalococcoidia bacterium]
MALYDSIGRTYSATRRPDPRIQALLWGELDGCDSVLNVGAGTGNYEDPDRVVAAVEPSRTMIDQRPANGAPAVMAVAEQLPFADQSFDGVMSVLSTHHWGDRQAGLAELRRVARRAVVILTHDPDGSTDAWVLRDYFPGAPALDRPIMDIEAVRRGLGATRVAPVPVPWDCTDGFFLAFWRRPEAYLDPEVRAGMSIFKRLSEAEVNDGVNRLRDDLASGAWERRNAELLNRDTMDVGYRLVSWRAS